MKDRRINLGRVEAVAGKEFIQVIRDPRSLALAIIIPILLLVLFGYALNLDIDNVPMAIWRQDNSQVATNFILNFKNSKYFKIIGYYDNYRDLQDLIDKRKALMALVLDKDFGRNIRSNKATPVQLILDGSDSNTATIALGYVKSVIGRYNDNFIQNALQQAGVENSTPIDFRSRIWFNADLQSKNFIVPGLVAIIMMVIAAMLTSLTIAREWERGTMEQLISTPVRPLELIIGKFIPYFVIGIVDLLVSVVLGVFVFSVPFRGSVLLLVVLSSLFLTGALALGIYISVVCKSQLLSSQMAMLASFLPTLLLSGFTYPISNMPPFVRLITNFVPARYFIVVLRGIYLKGIGAFMLFPEACALFIFAFLMVFIATKKFKKKVV